MIYKIKLIFHVRDVSKQGMKKNSEGRKTMCKKLKELSGLSSAKILEEYHPISDSYAVDMQMIMRNIGVPVTSFDFSELNQKHSCNIFGAIILFGEKLAVFVSDKCSRAEQRFILAHELGHCCLHGSTLKETKIECASDFDSDDEHEHAADVFADELLLPEKEFIKVCDKFGAEKKDICLIADIFCVPTKCVARRLAALDID